jgi:hypothetical protein
VDFFADVSEDLYYLRSFEILVSWKVFKVLKDGTCNSNESFFRPREEPVHCAAIN